MASHSSPSNQENLCRRISPLDLTDNSDGTMTLSDSDLRNYR